MVGKQREVVIVWLVFECCCKVEVKEIGCLLSVGVGVRIYVFISRVDFCLKVQIVLQNI